MELKQIRQILKMMDEYGLTEFTLEREGERLALKREGQNPVVQAAVPVAPVPVAPAAAPPAPGPAQAEPAAPAEDDSLHVICSPMVGTFYAAPSPDSEPYVRVGASVSTDTTVCIVEAMKIMNEIKAEINGAIEQVCVKNGQPIAFGQALFKVRLA